MARKVSERPVAEILAAAPSEYHKFRLSPLNRPLHNTDALRQSMMKYGYLKEYPILVERDPTGFVIREGHHRFRVATSLKIPFCYQVGEPVLSAAEAAALTKQWSLADYVQSYANKGLLAYKALWGYSQSTKIPLSNCIRLLGEPGSNVRKAKEGLFECSNDTRLADTVAYITSAMRKVNVRVATNQFCIQALIDLVLLDGFAATQLVYKIRKFPNKLTPATDVAGYLSMLDNLYNYQAREKVDVAYKARKAAEQRKLSLKRDKRSGK